MKQSVDNVYNNSNNIQRNTRNKPVQEINNVGPFSTKMRILGFHSQGLGPPTKARHLLNQ